MVIASPCVFKLSLLYQVGQRGTIITMGGGEFRNLSSFALFLVC